MRALVLSAGLGERLRPITARWAKPAVPFLNLPMISFPIFWLETLGLTELVVNTHYLPETIQAAVKALTKNVFYGVHFKHEAEILGSGGGIANARSELEGDENFFVANGDGVVLFPNLQILEDMLRFHKKNNALATLLVCPLEGIGTRIPGVWINNYDEVSHFGKDNSNPSLKCLHFASYMIFSSRIWAHLPVGSSNILYDVLTPLIKDGEKVMAFNCSDMRWFETGNTTDYLKASADCTKALLQADANLGYGQGLKQLLTRFDPEWQARSSLQPGGVALVAEGAALPATVKIKDFAVVGANTTVTAGITLERTVLLPGAVVENSTRSTVIFD